MNVTTPVITSAMGGQPGTLMMGLSWMTSWMGTARVGFGFAACTHPQLAHEPQAMMAIASAAISRSCSMYGRPPTMQYIPSSLSGGFPSQARMYFPLYLSRVSARMASAWWPDAAMMVSS